MPFGWDDAVAIGGSLLSAGSSIFGSSTAAAGQASTNAAQIAAAHDAQDQTQKFAMRQTDTANEATQALMDRANTFSSIEAQRNRDYQTEMSNSAYQRAMQGMRNAGLNPILALNPGGGASTPSGSAASSVGGSGAAGGASPVGPGSLGNPGASLGAGITSAGQAARLYADLKSTMAGVDKTRADTDVSKATEGLTKASEEKQKQDTVTSAKQGQVHDATVRNYDADTLNKAIQNIVLASQAVTAQHEATIRGVEADAARQYGPGPMGRDAGAYRAIIDYAISQIRAAVSNPTVPPVSPSNTSPAFDDRKPTSLPVPPRR